MSSPRRDQLFLVRVPSPLSAAFCDFLIARFSLMDLSDFLLAVCRGDLSGTAMAPLSTRGRSMAGKGCRHHSECLLKRSPLDRSEEHTSELQSHVNLVCRL